MAGFQNGGQKMSPQVKSRQRVADHGEVFTADREVQAMCDLVKQETERIDSRFLEPAYQSLLLIPKIRLWEILSEKLKRKMSLFRNRLEF